MKLIVMTMFLFFVIICDIIVRKSMWVWRINGSDAIYTISTFSWWWLSSSHIKLFWHIFWDFWHLVAIWRLEKDCVTRVSSFICCLNLVLTRFNHKIDPEQHKVDKGLFYLIFMDIELPRPSKWSHVSLGY